MSSQFDQYFDNSPTLKLLRMQNAGFVLSFFYQCFKENGLTQIAEEDLEAMLDQQLLEGGLKGVIP